MSSVNIHSYNNSVRLNHTDFSVNHSAKYSTGRPASGDTVVHTSRCEHSSDHVKDPWSAFTHFLGILFAIFSAPFLLHHYAVCGADAIAMTGAVIFLVSMFLLYTASTLFHTVIVPDRVDLIFRKIDHCMCFVLVAGTYTPICLTILRDSCGYLLLAAVWILAIGGMLIKICWITCPKWFSSSLYIVLGWIVLLAFPDLMRAISFGGFLTLLLGGIVYTIGGILFAMKCPEFNRKHPNFGTHEIFHLLILAGTLFHFATIYFYLV